ncbi:MAG: hypothetical protein A2Z03_12050 [Chloroflexi bacterium RBG_16_56_8]|nr:MAG: hypothetical protein A2Z03_12050 [Chloroflexi bacterium RBG_16_56_8]
MTLQISAIGLFIMAVFYALAAGLFLLVRRWLRDWKPKWVVLIPLAIISLVLPWADEVYISYRFAKLCEGAGVQVVRKVEVEGFYNETTSGPSEPGPITNQQAIDAYDKGSYRFYERKAREKVSHVEKANRKWEVSILDRPTARYHYKRIIDYRDEHGIHHEKQVAHQIQMIGEVVIDSETGEEIGRNVEYMRYPGWIEGLWVRFFGTGQTICKGSAPKPPELRHLLYHYVLIPTSKTN